MNLSPNYLFVLTLTTGYEYFLKHCWQTLRLWRQKPAWGYAFYPLVHWLLLGSTGWLLSRGVTLGAWLSFALLLALAGSLELPLQFLVERVRRRTGVFLYQLNFLVLLVVVLLSRLMDCAPRFALDYRLIFLFVFLAHPANHIIRLALARVEPAMVKESKGANHEEFPEVAAASEAAQVDDRCLRIGRRIGTIERWLIVLLMATGNIPSIGLVITAKSIARYPQLRDRDFAEYYLFGTLLSVVVALGSGLVVLGGI